MKTKVLAVTASLALTVTVYVTMGSFGGPFHSTPGEWNLVDPVYLYNALAYSIGARDGGSFPLTGYGFRAPVVDHVVRCGTDVAYGTTIRYGTQDWQCTEYGVLLGGEGVWTYPGTPVIPFTTRTPAEPLGSQTTAGIHFSPTNPGWHYLALGGINMVVEFAGTCTGACGAGTQAIAEVAQHNYHDGGERILASVALPCTAARGFCVAIDRTNPTLSLSTGCVSDAGILAPALPVNLGGLVYLEYKQDAGTCTSYPVVSVSGWGVHYMLPDGGGGV